MELLNDLSYAPALAAMLVLLIASGLFSCSEAALFSLTPQDRRHLASGNPAQQLAAELVAHPDRLLTAVLFWNLLVNVAFFALASIVGLRLQRANASAEAGAFSLGALLTLIFLSEMVPKSLGVLHPRLFATLVGVPLAVAVRVLDPVMPGIRLVNLLSRRLFWPRFEAEPYLEVSDLERAVELSRADAALKEQEHQALARIVALSELRADELMRPRTQFQVWRPPVALADLARLPAGSAYLLVAEVDSDEVAAAVSLKSAVELPDTHLEQLADPVLYVPWSTSVANVLDEMRRRGRRVAAVVNEFGETVGVLTFDDILDEIFGESTSRSARLLNRQPIVEVRSGTWHVTGMTTLRRLERFFDATLPESKSVTVLGVVQEMLERLPQPDDECDWGPFHFRVLSAPDHGQLLVELERRTEGEPVQ